MNELGKISRVIDRELPDADRETLLVIDATTGQNGLIQAKQFKEAAGITGIVLTKLDGTAKGGIVLAICDQLKVPVKYVGGGMQPEDLLAFEATRVRGGSAEMRFVLASNNERKQEELRQILFPMDHESLPSGRRG
jgi:signal recognition particle GTPase